MLEELESLVEDGKILLIEGESGAGKTLLACALAIEKAEEGKKCLYLSFLNIELLKKGLENFFGKRLENVLGKNFVFGQLELGGEGEFFEDIEFALENFSPQLIVVDPVHPSLSPGAFRDICSVLKSKNIAGIFCSMKKEELHGIADYVLCITAERVKGNIKREIVVKSKYPEKGKTYSFSIIPGGIFVERERKF